MLVFQQELLAINLPKSAIQFTENKGQWKENILFKADIPIGNIFIERNCLTYLFVDKEATHEYQHGKDIKKAKFHSVKVNFLNANPNPQILKDLKSAEYYNFFVGNPSQWASNVYAYKKIVLKNIYPKTDLEIITQGDAIKVNFILQVGADPNAISWQYLGANELLLNKNQLKITTSLGELVEQEPYSYQQFDEVQKMIPTKFVLNKDIVKFKLDTYDPKSPLVIDPAVVFGSYVGSAADNFGFAASFDAAGNAFGAGTVYAANFPTTTGAYDLTFAGGSGLNGEYARDAFIVKFNPTGTSLLFGTFIGGTDNEQPHSVTVGPNNEIIIFGTTNSIDFPVSASGFDKTYNGGSDVFVMKLNNAGSSLLASTYIGGTQDDGINGEPHVPFFSQTHQLPYNYSDWYRGEVMTDLSGSIYISTCTKSTHLQGIPLINAAQFIYGGGSQDGYVVKLNNGLSLIQFSTFVGGSGDESAHSICINNLNEPIIGGGTNSNNLQFGTTLSPYQGNVDGFVAKYSSSGVKQRFIYTGTSTYDQIFHVQTDDQNNIYTLGQTKGNMPKSAGTYGITNGKQFLQKFNSSLTTLLISTTFGKAGTEPSLSPAAFLVDVCGRIYVSGWGGGTNQSYHNGMDNVFQFPTTADAFQKTTDGSDFYLMALSPNFTNLLYASFYGGGQSQEHVDGGTSHFDKSGIVYQAVCAGCNGLNDFPTTPTAYSRVNPSKRAFDLNQGGCNLGMFKFDMRTYIIPPNFKDTFLTVIAGRTLNYNFSANDPGGDNLVMTYSGAVLDRTNSPAKITINSNVPGLVSAVLDWKTLCSDYSTDTIVIDVKVIDDACPVPNEVLGKIKILVLSEPIAPPFPECIRVVNDNTLKLSWINSTPNSDFLNYQVFRSVNNGAMQVYDSISSQINTSYNDVIAINNLNTNYCYQMISLNSCRRTGDSSRVICSLFTQDTSNVFINLQPEIFTLHAFDTFAQNFFLELTNTKDSLFLNLGGKFISQKEGNYKVTNGLGAALLNVNWIPDCNDISNDTIDLIIFARDNACPNFRLAQKLIKFVIIPPNPSTAPTAFCPQKISSDSVSIEWPLFQKSALSKNLYLLRKVNGVSTIIATFSDLSTTKYIDNYPINSNVSVCYSLTSSDVCDYFGDTSLVSCAQSNSSPSPTLEIYTATVVNDKEINLVFEQAEADSFWRYRILKRTGRSGNFEQQKEIRNLSDTVFIDEDVEVDKYSYCYQLVNIDLCGNTSIQNKIACTILLQGDAIPFENNMSWQPYEYWAQGINKYEVLKTEPGIYTDNLFVTKFDKPLMAIDKQLNYDNGLYEYSILAYENIFGNNQTSRSNTIDLIQRPLLYTPNAFTQNGDGLNDIYHMVPVFVKNYHLQVYNRWGERIFETYNKKDGFNGTYKGESTQGDVYFYIVEYTGWDESKYIKKGNFTLLR